VWKSNFHHSDKVTTIKSHKREEELFWLMVLEISVHGQLASLLWAWGESETSWWKGMAEGSCFPHDSQEAEREKKGPKMKSNLKSCHQCLQPLPPNSLTSLFPPAPQNPIKLWLHQWIICWLGQESDIQLPLGGWIHQLDLRLHHMNFDRILHIQTAIVDEVKQKNDNPSR
jgi:hypothetical protein